MENNKVGDMQVWWIPQIPGKAFEVPITSVEDGVRIINILAQYDLFQYNNHIKPDYCNTGGIRVWCEDNGKGESGWNDWYDEETGEDDPERYLEEKKQS